MADFFPVCSERNEWYYARRGDCQINYLLYSSGVRQVTSSSFLLGRRRRLYPRNREKVVPLTYVTNSHTHTRSVKLPSSRVPRVIDDGRIMRERESFNYSKSHGASSRCLSSVWKKENLIWLVFPATKFVFVLCQCPKTKGNHCVQFS